MDLLAAEEDDAWDTGRGVDAGAGVGEGMDTSDMDKVDTSDNCAHDDDAGSTAKVH